MLKNYVPSRRMAITEYNLAFNYDNNSGFSFPCDSDGTLSDDLNPCAMKNYQYCMEHPEEFVDWNIIEKTTHHYKEPAHGTCSCGRRIELWDEYLGACKCDCGRWYNLFGQELIAPE